jgi:hypothetical protein
MPEKPPIPLVVFWLFRGSQLEIGYGYLIQSPDAAFWAFPNEETFRQNPLLAGAVSLDPKHLKECPNTRSNRRLFLYQEAVNIPQEDTRTLQSVSGRFQGMEIR